MEKMKKKNQVPEELIAKESHELEMEELDLVSGGQNVIDETRSYEGKSVNSSPKETIALCVPVTTEPTGTVLNDTFFK